MFRRGEILQRGIQELLRNHRDQRKDAVIAMTTKVACSLANSCITGEPKLDNAREILKAVCDSKLIDINTLIGTTDFDDELRESPERFLVRKSLALMGTLWHAQIDNYPGDISRIIGCCRRLQNFGYDLGLVRDILCGRYGLNPKQFRYRVKLKIEAIDQEEPEGNEYQREDANSYFARNNSKAYDEYPRAGTTIPVEFFGISLGETPVSTDDELGLDEEP